MKRLDKAIKSGRITFSNKEKAKQELSDKEKDSIEKKLDQIFQILFKNPSLDSQLNLLRLIVINYFNITQMNYIENDEPIDDFIETITLFMILLESEVQSLIDETEKVDWKKSIFLKK